MKAVLLVAAAAGLALCVLAVPVTVAAQPEGKLWRIGYLGQASPQVGPDTLGEFQKGLRELGYAERQHYVMEVRNAEGRPERLQELAAELVALGDQVIE